MATLEQELDTYKNKYERLQGMFQNSEKVCRYLAIKYSKYLPILNELGKNNPKNIEPYFDDLK